MILQTRKEKKEKAVTGGRAVWDGFTEPSQLKFTCLKSTIENTRLRCKICSKLTIKTAERRHWCRSAVKIINFEHITSFGNISIIDFEQVTISLVPLKLGFRILKLL